MAWGASEVGAVKAYKGVVFANVTKEWGGSQAHRCQNHRHRRLVLCTPPLRWSRGYGCQVEAADLLIWGQITYGDIAKESQLVEQETPELPKQTDKLASVGRVEQRHPEISEGHSVPRRQIRIRDSFQTCFQ